MFLTSSIGQRMPGDAMESLTTSDRGPLETEREVEASDVRQALESLYDNASLVCSFLVAYYPDISALALPLERAQALRSLLLEAIEMLRPVQRSPSCAQAARDYEVLSLRYASGLSVDQIAEQLCVGPRQVYRDLRRAEEKLAELLRNRGLAGKLLGFSGERTDALRRELSSARSTEQTTDARDMLQGVLAAVRRLAGSRGVPVETELPAFPVLVRATPGVLRTILIQLLSAVIQAVDRGSVSLSLSLEGRQPEVSIAFALPPGADLALLSEAMGLARALNLDTRVLREDPQGHFRLRVLLAPVLPTRILVVEDNPSAVALYQRYLEGTPWQVIGTGEPTEATEVARTQKPRAIILDIMMPQLDGWTVLQDLRLNSDTASIPVIISSVVRDPGLGVALGAREYLTKPVSRLSLLAALRRVLAPDG